MFIKDSYYNENNISTITYSITTINKDFEAYLLYDHEEKAKVLWIYDKYEGNIYRHNSLYFGNKHLFPKVNAEMVKEQSKKSQELRNMYNNQEHNRHIGIIEEKAVLKEEKKTARMVKNFAIQKQIFRTTKLFDYVYNEGFITAFIKMNNGDEFNERLLYWCHKQEIVDDNYMVEIEKKERTYKDEDVNIEFVYKVLNGYKPKSKRVEI